jgi:hypothetical protein
VNGSVIEVTDPQDLQDFKDLVDPNLVHPVNPVKYFLCFSISNLVGG